MRKHRHHPPDSVEELEVVHKVDREALVIQIRALGRAVEHLSSAVEEIATRLPDGGAPGVRAHVDAARWSLRRLW